MFAKAACFGGDMAPSSGVPMRAIGGGGWFLAEHLFAAAIKSSHDNEPHTIW